VSNEDIEDKHNTAEYAWCHMKVIPFEEKQKESTKQYGVTDLIEILANMKFQ
jgi:hypothetical protein